MAKNTPKPRHTDDRPTEEQPKDFFMRDEGSVEWQLAHAWEDGPVAISWHLGAIETKLTSDASKETNAVTAGWIENIKDRVSALKQASPAGAPTPKELMDEAYGRLAEGQNDKQQVAEQCAGLRHESAKRMAGPLLELIDELKQESLQLAVAETVKAGYLRGVLSKLEKLVEPDVAKAIASTKEDVVNTASLKPDPTVIAQDRSKRRRDDLSSIIERHWKKANDRSDCNEVWLGLVAAAMLTPPPPPLLGFKDGEIAFGEPMNPEYLSRNAFRKRFVRLLNKEGLSTANGR